MVTPVLGCRLLGVEAMVLEVWPVVQVKVWIKNRGMVIFTNLDGETVIFLTPILKSLFNLL